MRDGPGGILRAGAILLGLGAALALAGPSSGVPGTGETTRLEPNVAIRAQLVPGLVVSVERACPPPAVLACRPGLRVTARASEPAATWLRAAVPGALEHGLRAFGYDDLSARSGDDDRAWSGRIVSRGEILGRWRQAGGVIEVAAGGLELRPLARSRAELASHGGIAMSFPVLAAMARDVHG